MKRIFTLLAVLLSLGYSASAQADLQIITSLKAVDTVRWRPNGSIGKIVQFAFVNHGPNALLASDTIRWASPLFSGAVSLRLPAAGVAAQDTVYYLDTVFVTAAPPTNPFTWCDSIWAKNSSNVVIADPVIANNKTCKSVRFIQVPNASVGNVPGENNGALTVFPNPANSSLNFSFVFGNNVAATATLRDLLGRTVIRQDLGKGLSGKQSYSLDISNLQNGVYFLEVSSNNDRAVSRVIIGK